MRGFIIACAIVGASLGLSACAASGYSNTSGAPTGPTPGSTDGLATSAGIVTINVVAINGAQSFSPNPATLPANQMVIWHNVDHVTHHVVFNDGSVDTGDLAPGASSAPMTIGVAGGPYHCSIHPVMVGSVNQSTASSSSPCQGSYCD
jgi:plastocyanin